MRHPMAMLSAMVLLASLGAAHTAAGGAEEMVLISRATNDIVAATAIEERITSLLSPKWSDDIVNADATPSAIHALSQKMQHTKRRWMAKVSTNVNVLRPREVHRISDTTFSVVDYRVGLTQPLKQSVEETKVRELHEAHLVCDAYFADHSFVPANHFRLELTEYESCKGCPPIEGPAPAGYRRPATFVVQCELRAGHLPPDALNDAPQWWTKWTNPQLKHQAQQLRGGNTKPAAHTWSATVCQPTLRSTGDHLYSDYSNYLFPPRKMVRNWAEHYLARGFQQIFIYVQSLKDAYLDIPGVTWFEIPWAEEDELGMYEGGHFWVIQHCLYHNKALGTDWTLFADVDEFLFEVKDKAGLVKKPEDEGDIIDGLLTRGLVGDDIETAADLKSRVYSFNFGTYTILTGDGEWRKNWKHPCASPLLAQFERPAFDRWTEEEHWVDTEKWLHNFHNKQLINVQQACYGDIHDFTAMKDERYCGPNKSHFSELRKIDVPVDHFALMHLSGAMKWDIWNHHCK